MLLTSDVVHCVINDPDTVKVQVKLVSIVITLTSSVKKVKKFTDFRLFTQLFNQQYWLAFDILFIQFYWCLLKIEDQIGQVQV